MLKLKNIKKDYVSGDSVVHALRGVSIEFRENEFVSILGQSGCGKTTLLNIIGGLDQYTSGDLVINGKSTRNFKDRDWDTYRNHSIGFVFQSYNLIPHQTVLSNVELALTLSGVSAKERRERAKEALIKVGLGDQLNKKPNQMSGGQMQRVAIARALVNNPEILLADEPTGALDSETSVQIMDLIKEIANDRLVIMVTHNPELAEQYSTRIINLLDGKVISDSNPYASNSNACEYDTIENTELVCDTELVSHAVNETRGVSEARLSAHEREKKADTDKDLSVQSNEKSDTSKGKTEKTKKTSMSFFTAFLLSLNNLLTKKGRTILTAFAGSIGIIGIALIFAVSNGTNAYINYVQESTLSSYPITLEDETIDLTELIGKITSTAGGDSQENTGDREPNAIYKDQLIAELLALIDNTEVSKNDLENFKLYLEDELSKPDSALSKAISAIQYTYDLNFEVYTQSPEHNIIKADTNEIMMEMLAQFMMGQMSSGSLQGDSSSGLGAMSASPFASMMTVKLWQEILPNKDGSQISDIIKEQYNLIAGSWPNEHDEVILIVDREGELDDLTLYALGLLSEADKNAIVKEAIASMNKQHANNTGKDTNTDTNTNTSTNNEKPQEGKDFWYYDEILYQPDKQNDKYKEYKVILPAEFYEKNANGVWAKPTNKQDLATKLNTLYLRSGEDAITLKITGIIQLNEDVDQGLLSGGIGYTSALTSKLLERVSALDIVKEQNKNQNVDIFTGLEFKPDVDEVEYLKLHIKNLISQYEQVIPENATEEEKAELSAKKEEAGKEIAKIYNIIMTDRAIDSAIDDLFKDAYVDGEFKVEKAIEILDAKMAEFGTPLSAEMRSMLEAIAPDKFITTITPYIKDGLVEQTEKAMEMALSLVSADKKYTMLKMSITDMSNEDEVKELKKMLGLDENASQEAFEKALADFEPFTKEEINAYPPFLQPTINDLLTQIDFGIKVLSDNDYENYFDSVFEFSTSSYDANVKFLGAATTPATINIYTATFADKDIVTQAVNEKGIKYTDYMKMLMSGITTIIDAITYVLVAFVATSLIVSSIMIGVITLISVQERTKEIGVLRAMGASKRDISRVFNAETLIIGFTSGVLGIGVTLILTEIINIILKALTGIENLRAAVGFWPAVILIVISMLLTLIAGIIPSRVAAKKDPVIALRSE